jgi:hypothetical protein
MNKERYHQIIDEVYNKYTTKYMGYDDVPSKKLFLFEIKNNPEFSEKWGLKIGERIVLEQVDQTNPTLKGSTALYSRKLITLTYNNETIESYE